MRTNSKRSGDDAVSIELGVSRRRLLKQMAALGMTGGVTGLAGCSSLRSDETETSVSTAANRQTTENDDGTGGSSSGTNASLPEFQRVPLTPPPTADEIDFTAPRNPERKVAFVTHNGTNQVFQPAIAMMNDAMNKFGWTGEFVGPTGNNQSKQVEIMNTKVSTLSKGDVMATTVLDANSYLGPIKNAVEKGIAVVQWNTTVSEWGYDTMMNEFGYPLPYVGQQHFPAGNATGITAYEKAEEHLEDDDYVVLPTTGVPGHPALKARNDGIRNALRRYDNVEVLDLLDVSTDVSKAINRVDSKYRSNPEINVIIGSGFWGPTAGGRLVENENMSRSDMIVGGFDYVSDVLNGIKQGTITFTIGQNYPAQGFVPLSLAYRWLDRGEPMRDFITGTEIVDESNVDFALKRATGYPKLTDYYRS